MLAFCYLFVNNASTTSRKDACMETANKDQSKAKGGIARAKALTPEKKKEIAAKAAAARWGGKQLKATHKGDFKEEFGIEVECYVLNDEKKTAVISQVGMGASLGLSPRGNAFPRFLSSNAMADYVSAQLREKIEKPIKFQWSSPSAQGPVEVFGYDVTILIDVCQAIIEAENAKALNHQQKHVATQARIILGASAKSGIQNLVYKLAGYDSSKEEVIAAFKAFVQEEAKKYEKEFPTELYAEWQRLYRITPPRKGKNWKEMHLTIDHIYFPLAKSNGKLLELLRSARNAAGDRNNRLFSFLNEIGARALRMQLGRVLEMAESSPNKETYEEKIAERFGGQLSLNIPPTYPIE